MKKLLGLLFVAVLALAGCGSGAQSSACSSSSKSDITMVSDTGGVNDKSFNQGTWEGVEKYCSDNSGVTAAFIESTNESQYIPNLTVAAENSKVVVAAGHTFAKAINEVATKYPDTKFIIIDAEPTDAEGNPVALDNVQAYYFDEAQAGYLAGYIAGKTTKTNHVGFVGGMEIPPVQKFGWGFVQGVQAANPNAVVDYQYSGSFNDSANGKTLAEAMYNSGADVIFTCAGGTNAGVVEASKSLTLNGKTAWVIGVDRDMYEDGVYTTASGEQKSVILTSAVKNVGAASYAGVKAALQGEWVSGTYNLTYADGAVGLPATNPNLEDSLVQEATKSLEAKTDLVSSSAADVKAVLTIQINGKL